MRHWLSVGFISLVLGIFSFSGLVQADTPQDRRLSQLVRQIGAESVDQTSRREQIRELVEQRKAFIRQHGPQTQPEADVQDGAWEGAVEQVVIDMVDAKGELSGSRDEYHLILPNGSVRLL